jgi:hypothetical protein
MRHAIASSAWQSCHVQRRCQLIPHVQVSLATDSLVLRVSGTGGGIGMRHDRATAGEAQAAAMRAIAGARPVPYWLDQPDTPPARPALAGQIGTVLRARRGC